MTTIGIIPNHTIGVCLGAMNIIAASSDHWMNSQWGETAVPGNGVDAGASVAGKTRETAGGSTGNKDMTYTRKLGPCIASSFAQKEIV
jgi:hypothetical protein